MSTKRYGQNISRLGQSSSHEFAFGIELAPTIVQDGISSYNSKRVKECRYGMIGARSKEENIK